VEFDSGAVSGVSTEDLVPLPPEGFEPEFDSDGNLMYYSGPELEGKGVTVTLDWNPKDGTLFWLSPKGYKTGDESVYTVGQIHELMAMLQKILDEHEG
jgi:hypothetical protein